MMQPDFTITNLTEILAYYDGIRSTKKLTPIEDKEVNRSIDALRSAIEYIKIYQQIDAIISK
jgi:hypothetical protein